MRAAGLACLAFAVLLPAASGAVGEWPVEAKAARLDIERGAFQADLSLLVLEQVMQTQPLAAGSFDLTGQSLHLEMDRSDPSLIVPGVTVLKSPVNTTVQDFQEFAVHGTQKRAGYEFIVSPSAAGARIEVLDSCSRFASSPYKTVTRNPWVAAPSERGSLEADTEKAIGWTSCSQARVVVTGDFLLSLWQQDFVLESDGKTSSYQTGRLQPQALTGAPDSTAAAARVQQAFLTVQAGRLSFLLADGVPHEVYLQPGIQIRSQSGVVLVDASGTLRTEAGLQTFHAQRVKVQGDVEARLLDAGVGKPLQAALGGELNSIDVDGAIVPLAVTTTAQAPWPWLLAAIGAVGLLTAPILLRPLRQRGNRRPARIHELTDRCLDRLNRLHFPEAEVLAAKLVDLDPTNPEAHYLLGSAIGPQGDPRIALEHHQKAHALLQLMDEPALLADNACQAARCTAALHEQATGSEKERWRDVTLEWMRQAVAAHPKVMADLALHPELQPFVGELVIWRNVTADDPPDWLRP